MQNSNSATVIDIPTDKVSNNNNIHSTSEDIDMVSPQLHVPHIVTAWDGVIRALVNHKKIVLHYPISFVNLRELDIGNY